MFSLVYLLVWSRPPHIPHVLLYLLFLISTHERHHLRYPVQYPMSRLTDVAFFSNSSTNSLKCTWNTKTRIATAINTSKSKRKAHVLSLAYNIENSLVIHHRVSLPLSRRICNHCYLFVCLSATLRKNFQMDLQEILVAIRIMDLEMDLHHDTGKTCLGGGMHSPCASSL